ncbi:MAG: polysaccharide pyruvyl transferase family protein [Rhodobacteraceae bacterium]|nr:polysaccharide pyruvyl transferase family protein [Paracoccaceae bacterium]
MSVNQPAYGPLPPEGGRVGFIGIPSEGRGNPRGNTGNYVHGYAARHILGEHVNISPRKLTDAMVEEYRASLTHLAFVTATTLAVDNSHIEPHEEHADRIERLGLPVVVFGLGSRAPIGQSLKEVAVHPATVRLLKVLSDHTSTIAVRGAFTADLCRQLGIHNVEVIGCQSCYMSCRPDFRFPALTSAPDLSRSIVNFTRQARESALFEAAMAARATVIGQASFFEEELRKLPPVTAMEDIPEEIRSLISPSLLRMITRRQITLGALQEWTRDGFQQFYTVPDWFAFLARGFDFCIGTRFHGNMASLQAGIPTMWVVHDMRTQEFCDLLGLPNLPLAALQSGKPLARLVETHFDKTAFDRRYPENYARFHAYLERHGVPHRLAPPTAAADAPAGPR